ncbi:class I SAM-dependent methyltransferase [Nitrososphaera viennensis]|uniref:Class I SAM-dependent methyltransferase n=1 Tax=Nitrososphaera viennensis TaxID=1034015 RepID=A0A977IB76_9ARCH|nr:class I SAM-dependent methyltransferase [Nitrososphaera viennensis]UVS67754.1 class I SAM-dependent methyltransferase [Nitrososphaera viennensis]
MPSAIYNNGGGHFCSNLSGLGSQYWPEVIEVLRSVVPVYNKVNRVISLGKDEEYRKHAIKERVMPGNLVLDAGSGFGNMSRVALAEAGGNARVVMYDPLPEMLANTRSFFAGAHQQLSLSSGIFEHMPFKDNTFDAVLCGYSLRDAIDLKKAIAEMHRVLVPGGRLIIVDLGKPDGTFKRWMVATYLKHFLGIFAYIAAGKPGLKFTTLYGTFLRWPKNSELEAMLAEKFSKVVFDKGMLEGAIMVAAYK